MNVSKNILYNKRYVAGVIMFSVGAFALLGIITAETLYPGYSTLQEISDLGASRPPNSIINQPSATIFNLTMIISGALLLTATYFVKKSINKNLLVIPLTLFSIGVLGVGVFPGNVTPWHGIFALITFISGGISAAITYKVIEGPFKYMSLIFGGISLITLISVILLGENHPLISIGLGGLERWVVYPVILWVNGFGGYLLGTQNQSQTLKDTAKTPDSI